MYTFELVKCVDISEDLSTYMQHEWSRRQIHTLCFDHQCRYEIWECLLGPLLKLDPLALHYVWCLVSYGSLCHYDNFLDNNFLWISEQHCHGWWMCSSIGQSPTFSCQHLWWNIVMDGCNVDEKPLGNWQWLQHCKYIIPHINEQGMAKAVGLTIFVADTTPSLQLVLSKTIKIGDTEYHN